ncbi:MAG: hypothetical protein JSS22_06605 [Proteobacteria bacterium]|nr:hypothetical protein [Pseudomonadota bacterium]
MPDQIAENADRIDAATGRSVCQAIGERLRTDTLPDESELPPRLQFLLDQIRTQDGNT